MKSCKHIEGISDTHCIKCGKSRQERESKPSDPSMQLEDEIHSIGKHRHQWTVPYCRLCGKEK
jgi:hypothetical protein